MEGVPQEVEDAVTALAVATLLSILAARGRAPGMGRRGPAPQPESYFVREPPGGGGETGRERVSAGVAVSRRRAAGGSEATRGSQAPRTGTFLTGRRSLADPRRLLVVELPPGLGDGAPAGLDGRRVGLGCPPLAGLDGGHGRLDMCCAP